MANHPSAEKRNRQRVVRTERNRALKSALRTTVKKARAALGTADAKTAGPLLAAAESALARAASKGVIAKKSASRVTARLASAAAKLGPKAR
ncbi:MAG TPA: 30S ribosomal protein S20 [Polyangiaceae bacterium]|nr:30S ribosomal protein S20 [Polyangiaceae bacterium]